MVLSVCALMLIAGYAFKVECVGETGRGGHPWGACYNDIQALWDMRGISTHTFPYITAYWEGLQMKGGGIEYPVLTGLFMWGAGLLAEDVNQYLSVSAALLAPFALLIAWLLHRMSGIRALYWAASPTLVLYSFHNWDLLVGAAAVTGLYLWSTGRYSAAAIAFGVGGAFKLYPLLFLAPLFLDRWIAGDETGARRKLGLGIATVVAINLPFMYINPPSWWITYEFHSIRIPNVDSLWGQTFPGIAPPIVNPISSALTAVGCALVLWWCYRRGRDEGSFPFLQACGGVLAVFLLFSKVQSPQFMLWLLPFLVVLKIKFRWWVAFTIVDVIAYVAVFRYFYDSFYNPEAELAHSIMIYSVFVRALLWATLAWVFPKADVALDPPGGREKLSHRSPSLSSSEA